MNLNDILLLNKEPFVNVTEEDRNTYREDHNKKAVLLKIHLVYFNVLCRNLKADCVVPEYSVWIQTKTPDIWDKREIMLKNVIRYSGWHFKEVISQKLSKKDRKLFSSILELKDASKENYNYFYIFQSRRLSAYLRHKEKSDNVKNMFAKGDQAIMETLSVIGNPFPDEKNVPYTGIERGSYIVVFYTDTWFKFYKKLNLNFEINILILDSLLDIAYKLFGLKENYDDIMGKH